MKTLEVRLQTSPDESRAVGRLATTQGRIFFEYDTEFLQAPLWLSPFKCPPIPGLQEHRDLAFGPIFGLFDDSLPDGWGLLLMDRRFEQLGLKLSEVSILHRLAFLGASTMGALTYHPPENQRRDERRIIDLTRLAASAQRVWQGSYEDILPELHRAGGSPGGARPKVLVGVKGDELLSGEDDLPEGFEHWLVKFTSAQDDKDWGAVEYAYGEMAKAAGLVLPPTRLFQTRDGARHFGVKRFDRDGNRRLHTHTFGNLIHANFRIPSVNYETLMKVCRVLTRNHQDVRRAFRQMVFNVAAHNRDDHVKNMAFCLSDAGEWRLAPSYDLTFSQGPGGEHSMALGGEGRAPTRAHVMSVASDASISTRDAARIIEDVLEATSQWPTFGRHAEVSPTSLDTIESALRSCRERLSP